MTEQPPVPVDDPAALRRILANTQALLLDFDGPVCSVFAGIPAPVVAEQLRQVLADGGHTDLPSDIAESGDPFDVFRYAATLGPNEARYVEAAFRAHEAEAIPTATPTPGAHDLIRTWHGTGRKLAIVSNNSSAAVETYLNLHDLHRHVDHISARTSPDVTRLKPSPYLINQAITALRVVPEKSTLIGDSITDIQAAYAASTRSIGYANKPGKSAKLKNVGANTTIGTMFDVIDRARTH